MRNFAGRGNRAEGDDAALALYVRAGFGLAIAIALSCYLISWIRHLAHLCRRRRRGHGRPLRKSFVCMVTGLLVIALILDAGALGPSVYNIYVLKRQADEETEASQEEGPGEEPAADGPGSEEPVPAVESTHEPTGPAPSVTMLFPEYFHLSDKRNSKMLQLFWEISAEGTIDASSLEACIQELTNHLEECAHPREFYSFDTGLERLFPKGEEVLDFEDVFTYEESMAQIRGAGTTLQNFRNSDNSNGIYKACNHLAIRSKDALFFGKKEGVLTGQMTWVLGELAFAALINEKVYGELTGPDLSDWYYRLAQIFEYMGDIADTKELRLQLYFIAAVSYSCAYEQISSRGLDQAGGEYGRDIWNAYFEMVYKVAVRTDISLREDFFVIILDGEMDVEASGLPGAVIEQTQEKLEKLDSYRLWKESPEGIAAAQELIARREEEALNHG